MSGADRDAPDEVAAPHGERLTAANLVTFVRLALAPAFGLLWWRGQYRAALFTFVLAGVSDIADGLLARLLDQRTRLGQFLDPLADKMMLLIAFIVAAALSVVPVWLAALVIARDLFIALAGWWLVATGRREMHSFHPTRLGKYTAFVLMLTIGLALLMHALHRPAIAPYIGALVLIATALTLASGAQYVDSMRRGHRLV